MLSTASALLSGDGCGHSNILLTLILVKPSARSSNISAAVSPVSDKICTVGLIAEWNMLLRLMPTALAIQFVAAVILCGCPRFIDLVLCYSFWANFRAMSSNISWQLAPAELPTEVLMEVGAALRVLC